jgi:hypothetical protein
MLGLAALLTAATGKSAFGGSFESWAAAERARKCLLLEGVSVHATRLYRGSPNRRLQWKKPLAMSGEHSPASTGDEILSAGPSPEETDSPEEAVSKKQKCTAKRPQKGDSPPKRTWACGGAAKVSDSFRKALKGEKWEHISITEPTKTKYSKGRVNASEPVLAHALFLLTADNPLVSFVLHRYRDAVGMLQQFYGVSDECRPNILPLLAFK